MPTAVVTGASSGIGRATARALAAVGLTVHAGVRRDEDADAVAAEGLVPLRLDVTDVASVEAAVAEVLAASDGRVAVLVNNAGIAVPNPIEALSDEDLARQLDVNVLGVHRVTRRLLPAIIEARGRIVQISSISGRVAAPFLGAYATSKFALEGYSDALRREVAEFGVHVALVTPGQVATPIWEKSIPDADAIDALPPRYRVRAGALMRSAAESGPKGLAPEEIAAAVVHAATATRPRARYALPAQDRIIGRILPVMPEALADRLVRREIDRLV